MRRLLAFALAAPLLACREPTQIKVEVTTDLDCKDHGGTAIAVGPLGSLGTRPPASTSSECGVTKTIGHAVLIPSGDNDSEVSFEVRTGVGIDPKFCTEPGNASQCIVARRALRFIPHTGLMVKVAMTADCRGVVCDPSSTCVRGACRPATIDDPSRCEGVGCGDDVLAIGDGGVVVDAGTDSSDAGVDVTPLPGNVSELSLGAYHSCALMKDGTVRCWGSNESGQVGIGSDAGLVAQPTKIPTLSNVKHVRAFAEGNTCALMNDGTVQCWGGACCGQLGNGALVPQLTPQPVTGLTGASELAIGRNHACALHADGGALSCWGTWAPPGNDTPVAIGGIGGSIRSIGAGDTLTVLGMTDGTVKVFGDNRFNQLGIGSQDASVVTTTPVTVPALSGVTSVTNGNSFVHARLSDGGVVVWGESSGYQLGLNQTTNAASPIASPALASLHGITLGDQFGCGLDANDEVMCWGSNFNKALGVGGTAISGSFAPVKAGVANAAVVYAGWGHACAIDKTGAVWCWGLDADGQVGDGATTDRTTPFKLNL